METVYDLWFTREYPDREDTELHIGIYATEADALAAIEQLNALPGFRDYPEGFEIHPTRLGETGWRFGFITEYGSPPKDAESEAFDLPAFD
jgi:homoserine kinase type II